MIDKENLISVCFDDQNSPLYNLSQEDKELLQANTEVIRFKKNERVYTASEEPQGVYLVASGKIKIFKEGVSDRYQIVRMAKKHSFVGYRALLANDLYSSYAVAIEESYLCFLDRESFMKIATTDIDFLMVLTQKLAKDVRFSDERTVALTQKHIRGRLAESLIFLKETYGFEEDGVTINVHLSREDIANLSNMTTSNAIRTLSVFAEEGVIEINKRKIRILDPKKLDRINNIG